MTGIIDRVHKNKSRLLFAVLSFLFFFLLTSVPFMQYPVSDTYAADEIKAETKAKPAEGSSPETKGESKKDSKKRSGGSSVLGGSDKEPTVITAQSLTADNKAKTALFTGSVVSKKGDSTFYADRMLVYYVESGDGENSNIDKIEADGNVKLVRTGRVITSGKAIYYAGAAERVVFSDKPRATENKNVVTGTIMTYYIKDDRSVVENSKIYIVEKGQEDPERQTGTKKASDRKKK
jgi:lipopolysaccharide export system protein LptA